MIIRVPEYNAATQAKLVCANAALFNFIRTTPDGARIRSAQSFGQRFQTVEGVEVEVEDTPEPGMLPEEPGELGGYVSEAKKNRADARRDRIAQEMWRDYVAYLEL